MIINMHFQSLIITVNVQKCSTKPLLSMDYVSLWYVLHS